MMYSYGYITATNCKQIKMKTLCIPPQGRGHWYARSFQFLQINKYHLPFIPKFKVKLECEFLKRKTKQSWNELNTKKNPKQYFLLQEWLKTHFTHCLVIVCVFFLNLIIKLSLDIFCPTMLCFVPLSHQVVTMFSITNHMKISNPYFAQFG